MNPTNQKKSAKEFVERWEGKGYEKGECVAELMKMYQKLVTE